MCRFAFYQEVRIARPRADNASHAGAVGAIVGRTDPSDEPVGYAVAVAGCEQVVSCDEEELEATGRQFRREDFYDDSRRLRIHVDEQGHGFPV